MEKSQRRHDKHVKDKRKLKVKSVKCPKPSQQNISLASNWDRYESEECSSNNSALSSSTDFSLLASVPITQGYHFQFKNDKFIEEELGNKTPNELFSLDLNMLKHSVLTVPFYERMGIDENYFRENQLKFMKRDAEENTVNYDIKYKPETKYTETSNKSKDLFDKGKVREPNKLEEKSGDIVVPQITNANTLKTIGEDADDLEEWLDNILDD